VRRALVILACLGSAACVSTAPAPRPAESGFTTMAGVVDPYEDGKRSLAEGRYKTAIERFAQALADDRSSLAALNGLAIAHSRLGRFDVAQTYFERALQIDATDGSTLNNYGWCLVEQGRLRDAEPFFTLALDHAAEADLPVVTGNLESVRLLRPPALFAALQSGARGPELRLVPLAAGVYRLETLGGPVEPLGPALVTHDRPQATVSAKRKGTATDPFATSALGVATVESAHASTRRPRLEQPMRVDAGSAGARMEILAEPPLSKAVIAAAVPGEPT
jgi:tetratricopeptide (TPR) repeat protein